MWISILKLDSTAVCVRLNAVILMHAARAAVSDLRHMLMGRLGAVDFRRARIYWLLLRRFSAFQRI